MSHVCISATRLALHTARKDPTKLFVRLDIPVLCFVLSCATHPLRSLFNDPVMLPCNHALCRECATQALKQNQRCPQCMVTIPNLRMLQGRNAWITEMVGSLRNCLIEVGASLTQHAPGAARNSTTLGQLNLPMTPVN